SLGAYQNLSDEEKADLRGIIDEVHGSPDLDPQLKLMVMAFGMLNVSGEDNYSRLMADLRTFLNPAPAQQPQAPQPQAPQPQPQAPQPQLQPPGPQPQPQQPQGPQ